MKGMSNNQIILSEAEKLAPATLHAIATAHHTAALLSPLAPFFPGFRRGESIAGHSFGTSLQDIGLHTLSSRRRCCPNFSAPIFRGSNLD